MKGYAPYAPNHSVAPDHPVASDHPAYPLVDPWVLGPVLILLGLGLVMVGSASITIAERQFDQPFYFFWRQLTYTGVGLLLALAVFCISLKFWERAGSPLLFIGAVLLCLVFVPGIRWTANGSSRWLDLGWFIVQPSELMKLCMVLYLAGYLVRHNEEVRATFKGFIKPMALLGVVALLLLAEPDFGAAVILIVTVSGMLFMGGVCIWKFVSCLLPVLAVLIMFVLSSPYRTARLTTFLDPWSDPLGSGFQLTQALIAFGRGEWLGVGLGSSVQKLFYLPEAHTDFIFAVLAEELGLLGVIGVIGLYGIIILRTFAIGYAAERTERPFAAFMTYGLGLWIGLQTIINVGVNMGVLPTKGLTLPLVSYGGSSMVTVCIAFALILRVDYETRMLNIGMDQLADYGRQGRKHGVRMNRMNRGTRIIRGKRMNRGDRIIRGNRLKPHMRSEFESGGLR